MSNIATKRMKDGGITMLSETVGIKLLEESYENKTIVTIRSRDDNFPEKKQEEYLRGFWEMTILNFSMPEKWDIEELYINTENKLTFGCEFIDWSFVRNERGDICQIAILSSFAPQENTIEGYSLCIPHLEEIGVSRFIYQFETKLIGKIVFKRK